MSLISDRRFERGPYRWGGLPKMANARKSDACHLYSTRYAGLVETGRALDRRKGRGVYSLHEQGQTPRRTALSFHQMLGGRCWALEETDVPLSRLRYKEADGNGFHA